MLKPKRRRACLLLSKQRPTDPWLRADQRLAVHDLIVGAAALAHPADWAMFIVADQLERFCLPVWRAGSVLSDPGVQHWRAGKEVNAKQQRKQAAHMTLAARFIQFLMTDVRLEDSGYGVGLRLLEVLSYRERNSRREVRLLEMLKFIHTSLWKCLFGRQARELEQSNTVSLHAVMHRSSTSLSCSHMQSKQGWKHEREISCSVLIEDNACRLKMNT